MANNQAAVTIIEHAQSGSLGLFYADMHAHAPDIVRLKSLAAELQLALPRRCILLCLDTAGRMEARAFRQQDGSFMAEPLAMVEDHALSQTPTNR